MRKLILTLFAFAPLTIFAQDFKAEIEKHREEYKADFLKNSSSPLKKEDFEYLRFYEPNEKFKVACEFIATKKGKPFQVPTSSGAVIISGVTIGKNARVGAGSVVIENVADGTTVFGNPAKKI